MSISKQEFEIRQAIIEHMEVYVANLQEDITNRKANILQTWYGMKLHETTDPTLYGYYFTYEDETFLDVDHAMEYAEENIKVE